MLNITSHQENVNQKHHEISPYYVLNIYYAKDKKIINAAKGTPVHHHHNHYGKYTDFLQITKTKK